MPDYRLDQRWSQPPGTSNGSSPLGSNAELSTTIERIKKQNKKLQRMYSKLGTHSDNPSFRDNIQVEIDSTTDVVKHCMLLVKQCTLQQQLSTPTGDTNPFNDDASPDTTLFHTFTSQFQQQYTVYTNIVQQIESKLMKILINVSANDAALQSELEHTRAEQQQQHQYAANGNHQQQHQMTASEVAIEDQQQLALLDYNTTEVQRRHQQMKQLESTMMEVAELFNDMQDIVYKQQENIDHIESNIENTYVSVQAAHEQLDIADGYAKSARRRKCWLVLLITVLIIVVLAITTSVFHILV